MADTALVFEVQKSDWKQTRFAEGATPELAPGQVLFRVDRFALTSNNISYALSGDMLGYWRFFPCDEGWGRIPVMGFANVIRSTHPGVPSHDWRMAGSTVPSPPMGASSAHTFTACFQTTGSGRAGFNCWELRRAISPMKRSSTTSSTASRIISRRISTASGSSPSARDEPGEQRQASGRTDE